VSYGNLLFEMRMNILYDSNAGSMLPSLEHGMGPSAVEQSKRSSAFRPDIEGLRGIAVLIVVAFHCGVPGFSGGFVGVDVFFVLSGYLITGLLVKEIEQTSRLDLPQFYARRVRRLLPASALTLVFTLVLGGIILAPAELAFAGRAARATALYVSNVFFAINAGNYFAPNVESNPMLHTWSLAVEEQFYLFWPLLIFLGLVVFRSRKALWSLLFGLTIVSMGVCVWFTANRGVFAFYQLPARAWEFGIGGLAFLPLPGGIKIQPVGWLVLGWIGVGTILGSAYFISGGTGFPGWIALVPALGTISALLAGAELPYRGVGGLLNSAPLQTFGTLSYSWYLWHWPFLVLTKALYPNGSITARIFAVAASLLLAAITHRVVENPIRFHPYLVARPIRSICCGAAITIVSLTAAVISMRYASRISNTPEMKAVTASIDDIARIPRPCVALEESPDVKTCVFGGPSSAANIVLFGDSHAFQWFNPLQRMAESLRWKLTTVVKARCPATDIRIPGVSAKITAACDEWRASAVQRIVAMHPSAVFIGSSTAYVKRVSLDDWRDGTKRTLETFSKATLRVADMRDSPHFAFDVPTCIARSIEHAWYPGHSCEMSKALAVDPAIFEAEETAAQGLRGVHFIDLTDQLCPQDVCRAIWKGEIMYRDSNHLTGGFADHLMPVLEQRLLSILNTPL
jgi:peptidoglycan/LPS O-acetylase OafA/YrhL